MTKSSSSLLSCWFCSTPMILLCIVIGLPWFIERLYDEQTSFSSNDIQQYSQNKTFVITGASSGLGLATVRQLANAGTAHTVIMACRSIPKCERVRQEILIDTNNNDGDNENDGGSWKATTKTKTTIATRFICLEMDLESLDSIRNFALEVQKVLPPSSSADQKGKDTPVAPPPPPPPPPLNVLMNNAGIMGEDNDLTWNVETSAENHMHVNHLGHFLLTHLLMDNLKSATNNNRNNGADADGIGNARIVSVSSLVASLPLLDVGDLKLDFFRKQQAASNGQEGSNNNSSVSLSWKQWMLQQSPSLIRGLWAYSASKRANLLFTSELQRRFAKAYGIQAVASHPGATLTDIFITGFQWFPDFICKGIKSIGSIAMMSSNDGAMTQIRAALDPSLQENAYIGPKWFIVGPATIIGTSDHSIHHNYIWGHPYTKHEGDLFWKSSEEATGIHFE